MSKVLTQQDLEEAFESLYRKGHTYVDTRQMLSLWGLTFTDAEWDKLEKELPQMMKEYLEGVDEGA